MLDTTQIFDLIDSYLPFEVCLHYQLLPLGVERDRVHLGMVDPHDCCALEYAVRMAQYWNYRLIPKPISHDRLHTLLSAYLNFMQLQGPTAYQAKLRLASQVAQGQSVPQRAQPAPVLAPVSAPPISSDRLPIDDATLILNESELLAIEASTADVLPLSGHPRSPIMHPGQPDHPLPSQGPSLPGALSTTPVPPCLSLPPPQVTQTPQPSLSSPASQPPKLSSPAQVQPRSNPSTPTVKPPTQPSLDQLGKTAVQLARQLRQAMQALQSYGTADLTQAQQRQQAVAALGRDLHQINQDFRKLWNVIGMQK